MLNSEKRAGEGVERIGDAYLDDRRGLRGIQAGNRPQLGPLAGGMRLAVLLARADVVFFELLFFDGGDIGAGQKLRRSGRND